MTHVVFFQDIEKLSKALTFFHVPTYEHQTIPVKLHMGEINNKNYPQPEFVRKVVTLLKNMNAHPFLLDTTVAYPGLRSTKKGYQKLASLHGFTEKKIGCPVIIDTAGISTKINEYCFNVAVHLAEASHIFSIAHVKGHIQTGMGGAIKNFGMGGVTRQTKMMMHHASRPTYIQTNCTFCAECEKNCIYNAIKVDQKNWKYNKRKCFGCGVCVDHCTTQALHYQKADLQFLIACAAYACVHGKKVLYLNELKRIAQSCDCDPFPGPFICPDIGYLLSDDPVAIDKASLDLIHAQKKDIFQKINNVNPYKQIEFGFKLGLGNPTYEMITI
ncbi:MAG: DUF362 domain-containing protein [Candidatus Thermoplasmatota archaeon]